jgi:hypothetical protein
MLNKLFKTLHNPSARVSHPIRPLYQDGFYPLLELAVNPEGWERRVDQCTNPFVLDVLL